MQELQRNTSSTQAHGSTKAVTTTTTHRSSMTTPGEITKSLEASLKSGMKLQPVWGGSDTHDVVGFDIANADMTHLDEAVAACEPMPKKAIARLVQKMILTMPMRNMDDMDKAAIIAIYVEDLEEYPSVVVEYVLMTIRRSSEFFPTWAELYENLELWGRRRMMIRDAIERAAQ